MATETLLGKAFKGIFSRGLEIAMHGEDPATGDPLAGKSRLEKWWDLRKDGVKNTAQAAFVDAMGEPEVKQEGARFVSDTMLGLVEGLKANFSNTVSTLHDKLKKASTDTRTNYDILHAYLKNDTDVWYNKLFKNIAARVISWGIPVVSHVGAAAAVHALDQDATTIPDVKVSFRGIVEGLLARMSPTAPPTTTP
ncbi:MAG: hypothetical protein WC775_05485 [Patescibacteria group bacterium]|jgi:hypothetical protein